MKITRTDPFTGKVNTMDLPVSHEQMMRYRLRRENIQDIFPQLSPSEREFIHTGITDSSWDAMLGEEE